MGGEWGLCKGSVGDVVDNHKVIYVVYRNNTFSFYVILTVYLRHTYGIHSV